MTDALLLVASIALCFTLPYVWRLQNEKWAWLWLALGILWYIAVLANI